MIADVLRLRLDLPSTAWSSLGMCTTSSSIPRRRVLVVDDHPDSAEASCLLLTLLGHEACAAMSGRQALVQVERWHPDVVFCDICLPDISGYEIARTIRSRHGTEVYLAALTGWAHPADRERAFAAGFDQHLVKPASAEHMQAVMAGFDPLTAGGRRCTAPGR
jgi:CheY-like chemotaxis protein